MSGGILDFLRTQGGGLLDTLHSGAADNRMTLMSAGMGMMSGANPQDAWANAMQGMNAGAGQDRAQKIMQQQAAERQRKQAALQQFAKARGLDPTMADEDVLRIMLQEKQADRSFGLQREQFELQKAQAGAKQKPTFGVIDEDEFGKKIYGWIDPYTGQVTPYQRGMVAPPNVDAGMAQAPAQVDPRMAVRPPPPGVDPREWRKAETQRLAAMDKTEEGRRAKEQTARTVIDDVDRALKLVDEGKVTVLGIDTGLNKTTGALGTGLSKFGGTAANDVRALAETIKANVSMDKLNEMRRNSPTGGALGNVSDKEGERLAASIANLENSQSEPQLRENLKRVRRAYGEAIHGEGNVDEMGNPTGAAAARGNTAGGNAARGEIKTPHGTLRLKAQ